jgi:hypothetical protein
MATKRMFTPKITESDSFLDMPATSQNLYFHLCMNADDDGFVGNPKRIERMIGSSPDDNRILYSKGFTIPFESGIIVIKHWRMHNVLRKDRYNETAYLDEKKQLYLKDNGSYTLDKEDGKPLMATKWQPNGNHWLPQSREDKSSEEESSIDECNMPTPFERFVEKYSINCDNYSAVIGEMDFNLLDKAFSESKWLQENFIHLSKICRKYNEIVGGYYKDFSTPAKKHFENERKYNQEDYSSMVENFNNFSEGDI